MLQQSRKSNFPPPGVSEQKKISPPENFSSPSAQQIRNSHFSSHIKFSNLILSGENKSLQRWEILPAGQNYANYCWYGSLIFISDVTSQSQSSLQLTSFSLFVRCFVIGLNLHIIQRWEISSWAEKNFWSGKLLSACWDKIRNWQWEGKLKFLIC